MTQETCMPYNIVGYLSAMIVVMRIKKGDNTPKDRSISNKTIGYAFVKYKYRFIVWGYTYC